MENYYNVNQQSMDINADYSNFENFVTFGSAQKRIDVFVAKMDKIQELVIRFDLRKLRQEFYV